MEWKPLGTGVDTHVAVVGARVIFFAKSAHTPWHCVPLASGQVEIKRNVPDRKVTVVENV